jgi:hypothetical protein
MGTPVVGRGGPRRAPLPRVDADSLLECLRDYVRHSGTKVGLSFGPYDVIARQQAACGGGLAANHSLLERLLDLAPTGEVSFSSLKTAFFAVITANPMLMGATDYKPDIVAGMKAERVMTMLNHLRRIKRCNVRHSQMRSKCSGLDDKLVGQLLSKMVLNEAAPFSGESASNVSASSAQKRRRLEAQPSVDSQGYPNLLAHAGDVCTTPRKVPGRVEVSPPLCHAKKRASREEYLAALAASLPDIPADAVSSLAASAAQGDAASVHPPAARATKATKPAAKVAPQAAAKAGRKGGKVASKASWESPAFGKLWITQASSQSYIQYLDASTSKKTLLVSFSAGAFPDHQEAVVKMASWICGAGKDLGKDDVQARKATLRPRES